MREATGITATHCRNRIRSALIDRAKVEDTQVTVAGKSMAARRVILQPFLDDPQFANIPELKDKTYSFVLADQVPGMLAELSAEQPANPKTGAPALSERITFAGEKPLGDQP